MTNFFTLIFIVSIFLVAQCPIAAQSVTLVQPPSKSQAKSRPLAKGIADVQARIAKNNELANSLQDAVREHAIKIGEILYSSYGQKKSPATKLIKLKEAYESVHGAVENGVTGQVWPAVGQFGQALLDFGSDPTFKWLSPQGQSAVNNINAFQQIGWEVARLKTTQSELDGYNTQIDTDTKILQSLQSESSDIAARQNSDSTDTNPGISLPPTVDPVLPVTPPGDFSALDDAILINKWLDLGNRAFTDQSQEDSFYSEFPAYKQFKNIAETRSPLTEVEQAAVSPMPAAKDPTTSTQTPDDRFAQWCSKLDPQSSLAGYTIWSGAGCDKIGSSTKK